MPNVIAPLYTVPTLALGGEPSVVYRMLNPAALALDSDTATDVVNGPVDANGDIDGSFSCVNTVKLRVVTTESVLLVA